MTDLQQNETGERTPPLWHCRNCGSPEWVAASLTGPVEYGGKAIKQCVPCGGYSNDPVEPGNAVRHPRSDRCEPVVVSPKLGPAAALMELAKTDIHCGLSNSGCRHCEWAVQFIIDAMDRLANRMLHSLDEAISRPEPRPGEERRDVAD